jgi:hypothetical protein
LPIEERVVLGVKLRKRGPYHPFKTDATKCCITVGLRIVWLDIPAEITMGAVEGWGK